MLKDSPQSTHFATIARIHRAHGKDGEVSVKAVGTLPFSILLSILESTELWLTPPPLQNRCLKLRTSRNAGDRLLVSFEGVHNRSEARELTGRDIVIDRRTVCANLLEEFDAVNFASENEKDFALGYAVDSDNHGHLGEITQVIETGANLVWVVQGPQGEVLLPVIDDVVIDVDHQTQAVQVTVLKGLIDEN